MCEECAGGGGGSVCWCGTHVCLCSRVCLHENTSPWGDGARERVIALFFQKYGNS